MEATEQSKKKRRPKAVEGRVFRVRCKRCDFEKVRRHFGDANFFAKQHEKRSHEVSIEQIDEPAKVAKPSTGKAAKKASAKKSAKKEAQSK
jgi:hypothetical protein